MAVRDIPTLGTSKSRSIEMRPDPGLILRPDPGAIHGRPLAIIGAIIQAAKLPSY